MLSARCELYNGSSLRHHLAPGSAYTRTLASNCEHTRARTSRCAVITPVRQRQQFSGRRAPASVFRASVLETPFVMPRHIAPSDCAYSSACSVSAVSPLWLTKKQMSSRNTGPRRSAKSARPHSGSGLPAPWSPPSLKRRCRAPQETSTTYSAPRVPWLCLWHYWRSKHLGIIATPIYSASPLLRTRHQWHQGMMLGHVPDARSSATGTPLIVSISVCTARQAW